jgi:hypothetical protein
LKATLRMALYSVRSERLFCEQLDYNLLRPKEDDALVGETPAHGVWTTVSILEYNVSDK